MQIAREYLQSRMLHVHVINYLEYNIHVIINV